ncbi:HIT domain-containing protein [Corynebacterium sp. YIM 101645]|uniref:HIT domain-containing protein n=1 Tax=Corynebacterium lemuris TaxID=1859292 RepID=A0ABT2FV23_9CORY|nr:HIT domain-containing protein [Corynebacterium lemuris]MCS5479091.1 HIT domain-containing protein [Corynebacterium lemuris]
MQPAAEDTWTDTGVGEPDRLTRLWAPYRMSYIKERPPAGSATQGDPFVDAPKMSDEDGLIVARGELVYAILNLYPYNAGHLMVIPYRKVADLENLTPEEMTELMGFVTTAVKVLKKVSRPEGINVGFNLGKASGGSVGNHLHMHVVPRWSGDSNFLTVLGGTKVLPQLLRDTRSMLAEAWVEVAGA